jgi:hypothetical protein
MTPPAATGAALADPRPAVQQPSRRPGVVPGGDHTERPDLRVVRPARRRGRQVGTVAAVVLFASLFAVAGFQTFIVSQQKQLDELNGRIGVEAELARTLDNELAELQSPQRITDAAAALGMVSPPGVAYLQPRPDDDARAAEIPEPTPGPGAPAPDQEER